MLPFHDLGLGLFLVLLAAGGVVLAREQGPRDPFTLTCAGVCGLLAVTVVVRDAEWIAVLCVLAGAALCIIGVTRGRTLPAFVLAGVAGRWPGCAACPGSAAPWPGSPGSARERRCCAPPCWSVLGLLVFGALFASADALLAEWVDACSSPTSPWARSCCGPSSPSPWAARCSRRRTSPSTRRTSTARRRAGRPVAHRFEWLVPVLVVNAVFAAFLVAQAAVDLRRARLPAAHHRPHLRRVRPPGLRPAHRRHGADPLVIWAAARKAARETAADRLWLRVLARPALRADAGRRG